MNQLEEEKRFVYFFGKKKVTINYKVILLMVDILDVFYIQVVSKSKLKHVIFDINHLLTMLYNLNNKLLFSKIDHLKTLGMIYKSKKMLK